VILLRNLWEEEGDQVCVKTGITRMETQMAREFRTTQFPMPHLNGINFFGLMTFCTLRAPETLHGNTSS
jgi:hypothetical protein